MRFLGRTAPRFGTFYSHPSLGFRANFSSLASASCCCFELLIRYMGLPLDCRTIPIMM